MENKEAINSVIRSTAVTMGEEISNIINQDGDDKTDGKVIDEIVEYLKALDIYKPKV